MIDAAIAVLELLGVGIFLAHTIEAYRATRKARDH